MEQRIFKDLSIVNRTFPTWWQAAYECIQKKLWGSVRVVLKEDNLYHIEWKNNYE